MTVTFPVGCFCKAPNVSDRETDRHTLSLFSLIFRSITPVGKQAVSADVRAARLRMSGCFKRLFASSSHTSLEGHTVHSPLWENSCNADTLPAQNHFEFTCVTCRLTFGCYGRLFPQQKFESLGMDLALIMRLSYHRRSEGHVTQRTAFVLIHVSVVATLQHTRRIRRGQKVSRSKCIKTTPEVL